MKTVPALALLLTVFEFGLITSLYCGQRLVKHNNLIFGGQNSTPGKWPWHASITHRTGSTFNVVCGGSIIDKDTILTAAHCLHSAHGIIATNRVLLHVGRNQLSVNDVQTRSYVPEEFFIHPGYRQHHIKDDIALIKLANHVEITDYIQPVCVWPATDSQDEVVGKLGTVIGFGLKDTTAMSDVLLEAEVPVVDLWDCLESNRDAFGSQLSRTMLCAGGRDSVGPCNGDSGGGLFFEYPNGWYIRGIVSFAPNTQGEAICDPTQYAVYTDVAKYYEWIRETLNWQTTVATDTSLTHAVVNLNQCGLETSLYEDEWQKDRTVAYSWSTRLEISDENYSQKECSAILITEWHLLTVASCVNDVDLKEARYGNSVFSGKKFPIKICLLFSSITVRLGNYNIAGLAEPQIRNIEQIVVHDEYAGLRYVNNLAILKMNHQADSTNDAVSWICLDYLNNLPDDTYTISERNMDYPKYFELFGAEIIPFDKCQKEGEEKDISLPADGSVFCVNATPRLVNSLNPTYVGVPGALTTYKSSRNYLLGLLPQLLPNVENTTFVPVVKTEFYFDWIQKTLETKMRTLPSFVLATLMLVVGTGPTIPAQHCGQRKIRYSQLIFGGQSASPGRWPWHATITHQHKRSFTVSCGGNIIDKTTILTAAHCLYTPHGLIATNRVLVHVARNHLTVTDIHTKSYVAYEFIIHPGFKQFEVADDVALIKLANQIEMNDYIQPVCLWPATDSQKDVIGKLGTVIGFGMKDAVNVSEVLLETEVKVVKLFDCFTSNREVFGPILTSKMLCAGSRDGVGPCNGDSGGGLFFERPAGGWYIRAIVSYAPNKLGEKICDPYEYAVYTDVAQYMDWIQQKLGGELPIITSPTTAGLVNRNGCGFQSSLYTTEQLVAYPWATRLEFLDGTDKECHAFLITEWHLLTAATCVEDMNYRQLRLLVRLGNYNIPGLPAPQVRRIETIVIHHGFDTRTNNTNNIALLRMNQRAYNTGLFVNWVCLNYFNSFQTDTPQTISEANSEYESNFELFEALPTSFEVCWNSCERKNILLPTDGSYTCAHAIPHRTIYKRPKREGIPGALTTFVSSRYTLLGLLPEYLPNRLDLSFVQVLKIEHYFDWIQQNL
uniref:Peptidase S1 domain-containing protein n=1 Tax=Anopheles dirus TaxID=7168 RepID=A0A182N5Z8_9DIPT